MSDAFATGLASIAKFVPDFMSGCSGSLQLHTYGPEGGEPEVLSYDFLDPDGLDGHEVVDWVTEGASVVISITRRRPNNTQSHLRSQGPQVQGSVDIVAKVLLRDAAEALVAPLSPNTADQPPTLDRVLGRSVGLTRREADIVWYIVRGFNNRQIAAECQVSLNSIKSYIRSAYRKIGVQARDEAIAWAVSHGSSARPCTPRAEDDVVSAAPGPRGPQSNGGRYSETHVRGRILSDPT